MLFCVFAFSSLAQFGTNYPSAITSSNLFATNHPGWLTASNAFATNAPGSITASNVFATNHPGWLTASNAFFTNAPGNLTASNLFTGSVQRVGIVTTNVNPIYGIMVMNAGNTNDNGFYAATNADFNYPVSGGTNTLASWFFQKFTGTQPYALFAYGRNGLGTNGYAWTIVADYQQTNATPNFYPITNGWKNMIGIPDAATNGAMPVPEITFYTNYAPNTYTTNYP